MLGQRLRRWLNIASSPVQRSYMSGPTSPYYRMIPLIEWVAVVGDIFLFVKGWFGRSPRQVIVYMYIDAPIQIVTLLRLYDYDDSKIFIIGILNEIVCQDVMFP